MATVTISGMLAAEAAALSAGWTEERLLDLAGERIGFALGRFFTQPGTAVGYLGKGHNAGDALVALRILRDCLGWNVAVRNAFPMTQCAPLVLKKWRQAGEPALLPGPLPWRDLPGPLLLLDGLLGTGASGAPRGPILTLAEEMQWLRTHAAARVASVDLPSGIQADTGEIPPGTVTADATFMIANAKRGLLTAAATNAAGCLALVPVEPLTTTESSGIELISPQTMDFAKAPRPYDFHKGMAGRVGIIAGSEAYTGAAVLAATGALRGGAGLTTLFVPRHTLASIASRCPPEIIVRGFSTVSDFSSTQADAWVVGCGLGEMAPAAGDALIEFIAATPVPMVIDADALNLLAARKALPRLTALHLLTPHPGEFRRLAPDLADTPREAAARAFADRTPATLLLKGSRSLITGPGMPLWCNSTGSPGMATGGQGDLLSGVIGARLAIGDAAPAAASLAAWLCGRAAEIALSTSSSSEESLSTGDVSRHLGAAWRDWRRSHR